MREGTFGLPFLYNISCVSSFRGNLGCCFIAISVRSGYWISEFSATGFPFRHLYNKVFVRANFLAKGCGFETLGDGERGRGEWHFLCDDKHALCFPWRITLSDVYKEWVRPSHTAEKHSYDNYCLLFYLDGNEFVYITGMIWTPKEVQSLSLLLSKLITVYCICYTSERLHF